MLWERSRFRRRPNRVLRDLPHVQRLKEWDVAVADIEQRIGCDTGFSEVIRAVYESYAADRGKPRFGDKTPIYLDYLGVVERTFPDAQYLHIVRDGRDAALSYLAFASSQPRGPLRPRTLVGYACRWRASVERGRRLGRSLGPERYLELRFEDLVADAEATLRAACAFLGLRFETGMLEYYKRPGPQPLSGSLVRSPPGPARSSWRTQMAPGDVRRFEAVAGDLLEELGYGRALPREGRAAGVRAFAARSSYALSRAVWLTGTGACRALPLCPRHGL